MNHVAVAYHMTFAILVSLTSIEVFGKKNCDYSDIVPISFYTHPPEGDRDSNYRDKINVISTPPLPPW